MSTLYLDRKELELRQQGKHLCLYEGGKKQATVPLNLIERVVIRGRSTITTGALGLLAGEGVGLLVLGGRSSRQTAILLGRPHLDARRRIAQYHQHCDPQLRSHWAWKLVRLKLRTQRRLLAKACSARPVRAGGSARSQRRLRASALSRLSLGAASLAAAASQ